MILGVIPARGGSKGLPGKNLRPLAGQPLIVHTIRASRAARRLDDLVVSTDDEAIAEVARGAGVAVPRLRPAALATDEIPLWPAIRDAVADWESRQEARVQTVVILQPTSPLRTAGDIDACVARFEAVDADLCATAVTPHDSPYFNMVETVDGTFVRPCSPRMRESMRRQDAPAVFALNGAVFVIRRSVLDTIENQFQLERFAVTEMPRARSVDIDSLEDFELADWWLCRRQSSGVW